MYTCGSRNGETTACRSRLCVGVGVPLVLQASERTLAADGLYVGPSDGLGAEVSFDRQHPAPYQRKQRSDYH
jgi:hypothetical protein